MIPFNPFTNTLNRYTIWNVCVCVCVCVCVRLHRQAAVPVGGVMSERPTDCHLCLRVRMKKTIPVKKKMKEKQ